MVRFDDVKEKVIHYSKMPIKFKQQHLTCCDLVDVPYGKLLPNEQIVLEKITDEVLGQCPILYEGMHMIQAQGLNEHGRKILYPIIKCLLKELGVAFVFQKILFEIKFAKRKEPTPPEDGTEQ